MNLSFYLCMCYRFLFFTRVLYYFILIVFRDYLSIFIVLPRCIKIVTIPWIISQTIFLFEIFIVFPRIIKIVTIPWIISQSIFLFERCSKRVLLMSKLQQKYMNVNLNG